MAHRGMDRRCAEHLRAEIFAEILAGRRVDGSPGGEPGRGRRPCRGAHASARRRPPEARLGGHAVLPDHPGNPRLHADPLALPPRQARNAPAAPRVATARPCGSHLTRVARAQLRRARRRQAGDADDSRRAPPLTADDRVVRDECAVGPRSVLGVQQHLDDDAGGLRLCCSAPNSFTAARPTLMP